MSGRSGIWEDKKQLSTFTLSTVQIRLIRQVTHDLIDRSPDLLWTTSGSSRVRTLKGGYCHICMRHGVTVVTPRVQVMDEPHQSAPRPLRVRSQIPDLRSYHGLSPRRM